jgi:hypothetical protein
MGHSETLTQTSKPDPRNNHMTSDAIHSEIELLRRLHRGAWVQLAALKQLPERSPEDDLRLRSLMRLECRLIDRIDAMNRHADGLNRGKPRFRALPANGNGPALLGPDFAAAAPDSS